MNTNTKRILAGVLLLGTLAVWVPQILGQAGEGRPGDPELDARVAASAELAPGVQVRYGPASDPAPPGPATRSQPPAAAGHDPDRPRTGQQEPSAAAGPVSSNGPARPDEPAARGWSSATGPGQELLDRLERSWGEVDPAAPLAGGGGDRRRPGSAWEQVHAYLDRNPLGGILHGADRSLALFGPRVVGVGDELIPDQALVEAIGRRHVLLRLGEQSLRVELPPITSRSPARTPGSEPADPPEVQAPIRTSRSEVP